MALPGRVPSLREMIGERGGKGRRAKKIGVVKDQAYEWGAYCAKQEDSRRAALGYLRTKLQHLTFKMTPDMVIVLVSHFWFAYYRHSKYSIPLPEEEKDSV